MSEHNPYPNENNTGHIWDEEQDIRELNNRPPRWYMIAFYASAFIVVAYAIYYPTIPWFGDHTKGVAGWTAIAELKDAQTELTTYRETRFKEQEALIAAKTPAEILADKELTTYAVKTAKTLFGDNCAACHGNEGRGNIGFPVLVDDDWLYGGTIGDIHTTLLNGRKANMPAYGKSSTEAEIDLLADYVISNGEDKRGLALYMSKGCVGCHMPNMKGMKALGSANLSDSIYRFKADTPEKQKEMVKTVIRYGVNQAHPKSQNAVMPAFADSSVVDANELKKIAIYVHQLGGGE